MFVLETSSSMAGAQLEAAKRELIYAMQALPDGVQFSVLAFNDRVTVWQRQLVPASALTKEAATRFVLAQPAAGKTASFDALDAAFAFDTESIYFLTDGMPSTGKIVDPASIVAAVSKSNRLRRITINAIGIGAAHAAFLQALSGNNFGVYHNVVQ